MKSIRLTLIGLVISSFSVVQAQQINISRIEMMPNRPQPYFMRDWKKVGHDYDSLVYNFNTQGDYLPLIFIMNNTINYPGHQSFGLHSFVGTSSPGNSETINVLPSLVSAALVGINKRNQNGYDWVKMSREYFNKRPEMSIYKNSPRDDSFDDWWYESMPNVFFYQLYSLYPDVDDYKYQFRSVADRFYEVALMSGGSTTPWKNPDFYYRGWDFIQKQPYKSGVPEPEAAGAIGWILYNAFIETGEKKYLIAAEWCIEYLNSLSSNPAYEIQLPYGVLTAARMNAEIGTDYDIEKMFTWCFSKTYLREWNVLLGKWGVYDINGLIGEDSGKQYAFIMNTFQQIGALVPLVRYDERFARAVGKWVLNAANSSRLFYSKYLDDLNQDSEDWSHKYDPNSNIAYEALLKSSSDWPEATGDAKKGSWAMTNLSLYSSSSVGYLAGLLDTTNIPRILKLDLNKTDFFQNKSFHSYLLFNPYDNDTTVQISLAPGIYDIYETISNSFIRYGVQALANISVPANSALVLVLTPAGGNIEYVQDKLLVNGIVVDYHSGRIVSNYSPRIKSLTALENILVQGSTTKVYCNAFDKDNDQIKYVWKADKGLIQGEGAVVNYTAPNDTGNISIKVIVADSKELKDSLEIIVKVAAFINHPPQINTIKAFPRKLNIGETLKLTCYASDLDSDSLYYSWSTIHGGLDKQNTNSVMWRAPIVEGDYYIKCSVEDSRGSLVSDSLKVMVRDFSKYSRGTQRAYYPFSGNANDVSGNGNHGTITGAVFTKDRFNNLSSALYFNGVSNKALVKNSASLNFQNAITISFWMKLDGLPNKETYIISHGSYNERYKISISNRKLRWTIKTDKTVNPIMDIDSESLVEPDKLYLCTVTYNGSDAEVWINGEMDSFISWTGKLLTTNYDLTIAQMLPNDANYNYKGTLDDIRIYDYMLLPDDIYLLNDLPSGLKDEFNNEPLPMETKLYANYPNPFNPATEIGFQISKFGRVKLKIFDMLGREITTLLDEFKHPGIYHATFSTANSTLSSGVYFYRLITDENIQTRKMLLLK